MSVRSTARRRGPAGPAAPGSGGRSRCPAPTETSATRGRTASRNSGSWYADPWWATFSTSARSPSGPCQSSSARCSSVSASPGSSMSTPAPAPAAPASCCSDRTACRPARPPGRAPSSRGHPDRYAQPARAGSDRDAAPRRRPMDQLPAGRRLRPRGGASTARPADRRSTPATPPTWSAWKWLTTSSGTTRTPSRRRQRSTGAGLRTGVDTTAAPGPAGSTTASPWPDGAGHDDPAGRRPARRRASRTGSAPSTAGDAPTTSDEPPHEPAAGRRPAAPR